MHRHYHECHREQAGKWSETGVTQEPIGPAPPPKASPARKVLVNTPPEKHHRTKFIRHRSPSSPSPAASSGSESSGRSPSSTPSESELRPPNVEHYDPEHPEMSPRTPRQPPPIKPAINPNSLTKQARSDDRHLTVPWQPKLGEWGDKQPYYAVERDPRLMFRVPSETTGKSNVARRMTNFREAARASNRRWPADVLLKPSCIVRKECARLPDGTFYTLTSTWIPGIQETASAEVGHICRTNRRRRRASTVETTDAATQ